MTKIQSKIEKCWFDSFDTVWLIFSYNIARVLALYKSCWAAMNKIFIYARPHVNRMTWTFFFFTWLQCEIWKKPAKNCPISLSELTHWMIQQATKIKPKKTRKLHVSLICRKTGSLTFRTFFSNTWVKLALIFSIFPVNFELFIHSYRLTGLNVLAQTKQWNVACFWPTNRDVCLLFFVRCENFALYRNKRLLRTYPCCRSVIAEFAHAFSCTHIELWMHLGSLESTQKARVALGYASSYSHTFFVLSKLTACKLDIRTLSMNKFLIYFRRLNECRWVKEGQ